nr:bifunctional adenosylcobinamide kinase/adenosylcobinamide-phosphate guanylyltransferase [Aestuariivirga litoralis]
MGGAASGKSKYAESLCAKPRAYVATAQAFDDEMRAKIAKHRTQRGREWITVEQPIDLVGALQAAEAEAPTILVDCLTLWLTNLVMAEKDCAAEVSKLLAQLRGMKGKVVLVSNELGLGIVPEHGLGRRFRDLHGVMNQRVAEAADVVVFTVAGMPQVLKGQRPEPPPAA